MLLNIASTVARDVVPSQLTSLAAVTALVHTLPKAAALKIIFGLSLIIATGEEEETRAISCRYVSDADITVNNNYVECIVKYKNVILMIRTHLCL